MVNKFIWSGNCFSGNKTFTVKKRVCDENGRILILKNIDR